MAYWRPLAIGKVEESQAEEALKLLLVKEPSRYGWRKEPLYNEPKLMEALRVYQDYLIKNIYIKAGEVGLPIIIHVCSAYSPEMRSERNNPIQLDEVFKDDDILRAETKFILIHAGYPYYHLVGSLINRFPNVFTDISFITWLPSLLEEILRHFISVAPSEKVMHASDTVAIPEYLGYCASNTRRALAKILNDFRADYGWTEECCIKIAKNIMSENARRLYNISA
jgi:predicted TIM-barrel fold metal-dependent hydrolase